MLACVISVGVQTWGTDVVALRRYWQMADDLGYARITYCFDPSSHHPSWLAKRVVRVAAQRAAGWEASYLTPAAFGERWSRLRTLLEREGRPSWEYRRSVELDVVLGLTDAEMEDELRRLCAARAIERRDALLEAALVGTADTVAARIAQYAAAGATDLMLGFADFPATRMVEIFAERVRPSG